MSLLILFRNRQKKPSGSLSLYLSGYAVGSGGIPLFVRGGAPETGNTTLWISGRSQRTAACDLYLPAYNVHQQTTSLFVRGGFGTNGSVPLYTLGPQQSQSVSGSSPLFILGRDWELVTLQSGLHIVRSVAETRFVVAAASDGLFVYQQGRWVRWVTQEAAQNRCILRQTLKLLKKVP